MIIDVEDIEFKVEKWDFLEDGVAGAIYFRVPYGSFGEGCNNGASFYGTRIRVATPCMEHSEPWDMPLEEILQEAAWFAYHNLKDGQGRTT